MAALWPHDPVSAYVAVVGAIAVATAVLIAVSSIDDLFVDVVFWVRAAYRRLFVEPRHEPLPVQALYDKAEQPIAIMVPAWREDDVIAAMIENTIGTLDYSDYVIFVGTYPNDPETIAEVERMRRRHRRVVRVEVPHAGPTCKADCLNAVVRAIMAHEESHGRPFAGMVLHDSEDVLHPLELKFLNYLLPRKDLIQLPVVSLERGYGELIAGTYMDEFAEWHAKDLVVREALAKAVPSAGVGTCFSRRAMQALKAHNHDEPFNTASLTEDYDIGARLAAERMPSIIAHYPVDFRVKRKTLFGLGKEKSSSLRMSLCVREYFPNTFKTSYRQKARWTLGISLQGWAQLGWTRSLWTNYFLVRDRKALITPSLALVSYFVLINLLLLSLVLHWMGRPDQALLPDTWWFRALLWFNAVALVARVVQRFYFVNRVYGWEHGLMSLVRLIVASFVNFMATARALRIFFSNVLFGTPIVWDKTMHQFPSSQALGRDRRPLGEILVSWEAATPARIDAALAEQARSGQRLGRILMAKGWLDDETLAEAIAMQSHLPRTPVGAEAVSRQRGEAPAALCVRLRALPVGRAESGAPIVAVARPLTADEAGELAKVLGGEPLQKIARESEINAGLRLLAGDGDAFAPGLDAPLIGDLLIEGGHVRREAFDEALGGYEPVRDGRIGEFLVRRGVVAADALSAAIDQQRQALAERRP
ncbi:glycosyl transferase family protein [Caulobacter sp. CCUG 60055]|nr:glycosyl transferase family protein [Caulobacter sp. CCUG 60055]